MLRSLQDHRYLELTVAHHENQTRSVRLNHVLNLMWQNPMGSEVVSVSEEIPSNMLLPEV